VPELKIRDWEVPGREGAEKVSVNEHSLIESGRFKMNLHFWILYIQILA